MVTEKKTKRITKQTYKEYSKRDHSPKWDGHEQWSTKDFQKNWTNAMDWYRLESNGKDLKLKVIEWMNLNGYTKEEISSFKKTQDWRCSNTVGAIAASLLKGMPTIREDFNFGKNQEEWLRKRIKDIINEGQNDISKDDDVNKKAVEVPVITIQDRVKEQALEMSDELDKAIDNWHENPDKFDPKAFKIINLLRAKGVKSAHARYIKNYFNFDFNELKTLFSDQVDEQLKEAYSRWSRKNLKKLLEFYELVNIACDQLIAEAKITRKPKAKKIKPVEEIVKKLKFKISDNKLSIVSVPATGIIGAQMVVVYNVRTRKLGLYKAIGINGLNVKGSSIIDFTELSQQKTLRKPDVQLKEFKEQNTFNRAESWFNKIKTTETKLNGRTNEDTIILKIFK